MNNLLTLYKPDTILIHKNDLNNFNTYKGTLNYYDKPYLITKIHKNDQGSSLFDLKGIWSKNTSKTHCNLTLEQIKADYRPYPKELNKQYQSIRIATIVEQIITDLLLESKK